MSSSQDSAPFAHAVNSTNLAEWLAQRTSALDDPRLWNTLPPVQHAHGCEQYAAVAAAAVGLQQQQQEEEGDRQQQQGAAAAAASGAHEAGFDAFMTGVVFLGMLRLYEVTGGGVVLGRGTWAPGLTAGLLIEQLRRQVQQKLLAVDCQHGVQGDSVVRHTPPGAAPFLVTVGISTTTNSILLLRR